ncbi:hypothetical protein L6R52_15065 [Myxococcota bacterium]|nr:hypothetical protein [Myxococcota bacterium]
MELLGPKFERIEVKAKGRDLSPIHRELDEARAEGDERWRNQRFALVGAGVAAFALLLVLPPLGLVALILLIFGAVSLRKTHRRRTDDLSFAQALVDALAEDLQPSKNVAVGLDLSPWDSVGFKVSEVKRYKKTVYKYKKNWLEISAVLADGTELDVLQRGHFKKKGATVSEKRHLMLRVKPAPWRYDLARIQADGPVLERQLKATMRQLFHDPPELFHAHVQPEGDELVIKVRQDNAPIFPMEVVALATALMKFFRDRRGEVRAAL